jgi:GTP-binding protein
MTVADIPGIIEGAAEGKGLGHDFLRHIERTKVLLFLIDLGDGDPEETYRILEEELSRHSKVFLGRPRVVALNKADVTENRERYDELTAEFDEPFLISGVTGEGVPDLLEHLWQQVELVRNLPDETVVELPERSYVYEAPYTIEKVPGGFRIAGPRVIQAARMVNFDNEEALRYFHNRLQRLGVLKALHRMGAQEGQTIFIEDFELEYHPD